MPAGPSWHSRARSLRAPGRRPGNAGLAGRPRRRSLSGRRAGGGRAGPSPRAGRRGELQGRAAAACWRCSREAAPDSSACRRCRRSGCHGDRGTPGGGGGDTVSCRGPAPAAPPRRTRAPGRPTRTRGLPARAGADLGPPCDPCPSSDPHGARPGEGTNRLPGAAVPPIGNGREEERALWGRGPLVEVSDPIKAESGARGSPRGPSSS